MKACIRDSGFPPRSRRNVIPADCGVVVLVIVLVCGALFYLNRPLSLVVRNVDSEALHAVVVHVTGNSISIGDIPAGQSRKIRLTTTGESHVELELATGSGRSRDQTVVKSATGSSGIRYPLQGNCFALRPE